MTQRVPAASTTFRKQNVMTIFVILKSGTDYTKRGLFFRRIQFFLGGGGVLVRSGLNAGWFLVNSHYKRLCASLRTFETVQEIKKWDDLYLQNMVQGVKQ